MPTVAVVASSPVETPKPRSPGGEEALALPTRRLSQSQVAVMLAQGRSVHGIAAAARRRASTVRQFLKQIYNRRDLTGRADLVRLVLTPFGPAGFGTLTGPWRP